MPTEAQLTVSEAAARLGKRVETVRRWIVAGTLPAIRQGPHVFVDTAAVDAMSSTCEHCRKKFIPARPGRAPRFCSPACRWAATYERNKATHPAARGPGRPPLEHPRPSDPGHTAPDRLRTALDFARRKPTA